MPHVSQIRRDELVQLTEAAVAVGLSVLLGNLRLLELPNGGSVALATLPLLAFSRARGVRAGVLAGSCAGVAHALAGGTIVHPVQLGLDYLLAYAALGLAGLGSGAARASSRRAMLPAILLAMSLHLAAMVVSGVVFFATVAGDAALTYALAYNAATVLPEAALAIWLTPPLVRALARANPAESWRRGLLPPPPSTVRTPRFARLTPAAPVVVSADVTRIQLPDRPPPPATPVRASFSRPAPFAALRARQH